MNNLRLIGLALGGSFGLLAAAPATAVTTTLDFSGNICGVAGNQPCGNYSQIGQNYGDGTGVNVSYRSFNSGDGTTFEPYLKYWNTGYGDLVNVVWGGANSSQYGAEITFSALAGYELRILGFDAGCYLNRTSCQNFPFSINALGGAQVASGSATPAANSHDTFAFNMAYSSNGYVLSWGPDAYDGGLDNIAFEVRQITMGVVPEPSTWALLILGFGLVGGAMRRRTALSVSAA